FSVPAATLGGLSGSTSLNLGGTALTVGANSSNTTYTGAITSTAGFTKTGNGTITLNNFQNYSGATNISGGVLKVIGNPVVVTSLPSVGGLQYQLDASNALSASGSSVSSWNDVSGNGKNFTVAGSATAPTLVTNALNGLPVVRFDYTASNALTYT